MPTSSAPKSTAKSDRLSAADFDMLLQAIREEGLRAEASIQDAFMASWRDLACSHSCERLTSLWDVLAETKSPFRAQVSLAMRALAVMPRPSKSSQKWVRTGRAPLSYDECVWILALEAEDKRVL